MTDKQDRRGDQTPTRKAYDPPRLKKHGSLAELTRSGTGTTMEAGMGPSSRFQ